MREDFNNENDEEITDAYENLAENVEENTEQDVEKQEDDEKVVDEEIIEKEEEISVEEESNNNEVVVVEKTELDSAIDSNINYTEEAEKLKKEINVLKGKLTTYETKRDNLIEKKDGSINKKVYDEKRRIEKTYGEILTEAEKRLSAAKSLKASEKKKNIDTLIEKNTRSLRENNVYLNNEVKKLLKENKIPRFVNTEFYFSIWSPYTFKQVLICIFVSIISLFLVPTIICFFAFSQQINGITNGQTFFKCLIIALVYSIWMFLVIVLWLFIEKITKKKPDVIKEIKELKKEIKENDNEIKKVAKQTNNNVTEDQFDYTKLDREIEAGKLEVEKRKEEKKEALERFDNVNRLEITKAITNEFQKQIDGYDTDIEKIKEELKAKQLLHDEYKIKSLNNGNSV